MMNRRNVLRAFAGTVATLPALLAAKPVAAQPVTAIEVLPGQVGVLDTDGLPFADWPTEGQLAELAEPRALEIVGLHSVSLTLVGETGPERVTSVPGIARLFIEDGG